MADTLSELSSEDKAKNDRLREAFEKGGEEGLNAALKRLEETDHGAYCRIMLAAGDPKEVRELLEEALLNEGLTVSDIRRMAAEAETPKDDFTRKHALN
jgi:hypothetical protein